VKVTAIIPCFNGAKTLEKCLNAIFSQQKADFTQVIVVNNNSTDQYQKIIDKFEVDLIHCESQSAGAARNMGWRNAKSDLIAFIDMDTVIANNWLYEMQKKFSDDLVVAADCKLIPNKGSGLWIDQYRYSLKQKNTNENWSYLDIQNNVFNMAAAACAYRRTILKEFGGFDQRLQRLEDTDLAYKAAHLGTLVHCEKAVAYDDFSGGMLDYLKRAFNNGRASCDLWALWGEKKVNLERSSELTGNMQLFYQLELFIFQLGILRGGFQNDLKAQSKVKVKLIKACNEKIEKRTPDHYNDD
jgi:glycosyltransferase involved in cell wall biosynthesis